MRPLIDTKRCNNCGECVEVCPNDVYMLCGDRVVVLSPQDCIECMACIDICENKAIYMGD